LSQKPSHELGRHVRLFCRQGRHSGSHFTGALLLPPPFSISQNPAKTQALAALPRVVTLMKINCALIISTADSLHILDLLYLIHNFNMVFGFD
jgi:hypothetical protein